MFSILEPGKRIPPHRGPFNGVLRVHLGLLVPAPAEKCGLRVAGSEHFWQEGRAFVYHPVVERGEASRKAVKNLMQRFFQDSPELLILNVLEDEQLDETELHRLKKLIAGEGGGAQ